MPWDNLFETWEIMVVMIIPTFMITSQKFRGQSLDSRSNQSNSNWNIHSPESYRKISTKWMWLMNCLHCPLFQVVFRFRTLKEDSKKHTHHVPVLLAESQKWYSQTRTPCGSSWFIMMFPKKSMAMLCYTIFWDPTHHVPEPSFVEGRGRGNKGRGKGGGRNDVGRLSELADPKHENEMCSWHIEL